MKEPTRKTEKNFLVTIIQDAIATVAVCTTIWAAGKSTNLIVDLKRNERYLSQLYRSEWPSEQDREIQRAYYLWKEQGVERHIPFRSLFYNPYEVVERRRGLSID